MTVQELNNKLTKALKDFIKQEGLFSSGKLYRSIRFKCTFTNFKLDIKFDSLEYILYLENGRVVEKFFDLDSTTRIIEDFYSSQIEFNL